MTETRWQEAKRKIKTAGVGATYRPRVRVAHDGYVNSDVVVVEFHEPTGRVWWQQASGPRPGDAHRDMDCMDFLEGYELKRNV